MNAVTQAGMAPEELDLHVSGEVWGRWVAAEPDLSEVDSLGELALLRGRATDRPLGALVRLAARDGGNDELAGIAVVHQLEGGVRRLVRTLHDLSSDIDTVVVGTLWEKIRTFPWQRRRSAYAASLILDTRAAVMASLLPDRGRGSATPVVLVDPQSWPLDAPNSTFLGARLNAAEQTERELNDLLDWARKSHSIHTSDVDLIRELIQAGYEVADLETPRATRGVSSQLAVRLVASRRGCCGKTVIRERDRIVARLREAANGYLYAVA